MTEFDSLVTQARACRLCSSMDGQIRVLSRFNGPIDARIMVVGEAPGRFGAGKSGVPFQGDESGRRLQRLIEAAGWDRNQLFISNAVLCNPLDSAGRNRAPTATEITYCSSWLDRQIQVINPALVVALGASALRGLGKIEKHTLTVKDSAAMPVEWSGRFLSAKYHPGARAAIHRPVEQQLEDFHALGNWWRTNDGNAGYQ